MTQVATSRVRQEQVWSPADRIRRWVPPVVAYLAAHAVYWLAAGRLGYSYWGTESRVRWDSGLYLKIAQSGYVLEHCTPETGYAADGWCGTSGWFPLYPLVMRLLSVFGLSFEAAGVLIAEVCALGVLAMVWLLLGTRLTARNAGVLAVAAAFPAGVYFHAVFPMSLVALLAAVMFVCLTRERWLLAGLAGAAAAAAYPIGILLAPAAVVYVAAAQRGWRWLPRAALVGGLTAAGTAFAFAVMWSSTGRWNAYLLTQAKYGNGLHDPLATYADLLAGNPPVLVDAPRELVGLLAGAEHAELLFATLLLILSGAAVWIAIARRRLVPLDLSLLAYELLIFIVPLVVGQLVAQFRSHTLMLPALVLLRHLPRPVLYALVVLAAPLAYVMAQLFFSALLV